MLARLAPHAALVVHGGSLVFGPTGPLPAAPVTLAPPPFLAARARIDRRLLEAAAAGQRAIGVYGAFVHGGSGAAIPLSWAAAARQAGFVPCPGDGRALWSLTSVADWAELMVLAAMHGQRGPVFAAHQQQPVAALAEALGWAPADISLAAALAGTRLG